MYDLFVAFDSLRKSFYELLKSNNEDLTLFIQQCESCEFLLSKEKLVAPFDQSIKASVEIFQFQSLAKASFWQKLPRLHAYFGSCIMVKTSYEEEFRQYVIRNGHDHLLNFEK